MRRQHCEDAERACILPWAPGVNWTVGENVKDGQYLRAVFPDGTSSTTWMAQRERPSLAQWEESCIWAVWNWLGQAMSAPPSPASAPLSDDLDGEVP